MRIRRFCVFKRQRQDTYYAQIKNPETGKYLPARSTGTSDKSEACMIVSDWLHNGFPEKSSKSKKRPLEEIYTLDTIIDVLNSMNLSSQDAIRITSVHASNEYLAFLEIKKRRNEIVHSNEPMMVYQVKDMIRIMNRVMPGIGGLLILLRRYEGKPEYIGFFRKIFNQRKIVIIR